MPVVWARVIIIETLLIACNLMWERWVSTLRLLFATQPLRSFLSTQNRASVARRPVRSRGVEARVHHVKRRPSTRRRAVGGHWMARSNAQPRSPATPGPRRPLRSSVRQTTTTMVVRGLGRAFLCLPVCLGCAFFCRALHGPGPLPSSIQPLRALLGHLSSSRRPCLAAPLHDGRTTKRPGMRGTKSLHLAPAPAGRGFAQQNSP